MESIVSTPFYAISIDRNKNRLYVKFMNDWANPNDVKNAPADMERAVKQMRPGFSVLSDASEVKIILVPNIIKGIQAAVAKGAPSKVASVWSDHILTQLQAASTAGQVGTDYSKARKNFVSIEEALAWLDGVSQSAMAC